MVSPEDSFEREPEQRIIVPEQIGKRHKFVRRTLANLRQQVRGPRLLVETRGADRFRVSVARASLERVERLLQTLIDVCLARGFALVEGEFGKSFLTVKVHDEPVELSVSERTKRAIHQLSENEEIRAELNPGWKPPLYDVVPTGVLAIRVVNSPDLSQRATVRDRAGFPLEERLNEVFARMAEAARLIRERREAQERQRKKWEDEERRRAEERQRAELEGARLHRMEELVDQWRAQETLRAFLAAIRKRMEVARPELLPAAQAWIDWAEDYVEQNHPADPLFFEPLIQPGTSEFWHYSTQRNRRLDF